MRKSLLLLGMTVLALAIAAPEAGAAGPFCFSTAPFGDVLVWFVNSTGGNQFAGSGRDLAGDRAQTVAGFVTGSSAVVSYTTYSKSSGSIPVTAGATLSLATGTGPGACFAPDFAGCGNFTLAAIACPPGATSDAEADAALSMGPIQGMSP
jgi:hypothetical protein